MLLLPLSALILPLHWKLGIGVCLASLYRMKYFTRLTKAFLEEKHYFCLVNVVILYCYCTLAQRAGMVDDLAPFAIC